MKAARKAGWARLLGLACLFVCFLVSSRSMGQRSGATQILWKIGESDNRFAEFALAPDRHRDFLLRDFGWPDRFYYVGRSAPGEDWPSVLPGPADAWAGSDGLAGLRTHVLQVFFELEELAATGACALVIDLFDTQAKNPPRLQVTVNGRRHDLRLKGGGGDASIQGAAGQAREQLVRIEFSVAELRAGFNQISLTSIQGSWMQFDQVRLETPEGCRLAPARSTVIRSVAPASFELGGEAARCQPLLVDVEPLDGSCRLVVDLEGRRIFEEEVEPGRTVLEVPMPAMDTPTRSRVTVTVDGQTRFSGEVGRGPKAVATPADYVDPFMGTAHSRWMIAPGPWMPFGMVKLSPDNQDTGWQAGYDPSIDNLAGFSHIHEWTMAGLLLMPATGPLRIEPGSQYEPESGYRSRFDKEQEEGGIGYYRVFLKDYGINAELTATTRAALQRYTFPATSQARVLIDLQFPAEYAFQIRDFQLRRVGFDRVEGYSAQHSPKVWSAGTQDYTVHFVIEFSRPFERFGTWCDGDVQSAVDSVQGNQAKDVGAFVEFDCPEGGQVLVRSAISLVSVDQAALNLEREMAPFGWDFEAVVRQQRDAWNNIFDRVRIKTRDHREKVRFYTNLYRAYCARNIWSDVNGQWVDPEETVQKLSDPLSPVLGCDAFWNTFWNLNQVWNLVTPEWSAVWVRSQLAMYDACGWLAKGPAGMEYIPVMVAEHEIPLMVAAYQMGIRNFDAGKAFEAMLKMQTTPAVYNLGGGAAGNRDLEPYLKYGFVPEGMGFISNTMEYSYDDWCVAQMANALGRRAEYERFMERAGYWKNIFDAKTGMVRPKKADGSWVEPFNPFEAPGFVEGNAWQYTWFVPQDPAGLVEVMGGDRFVEELNRGFEVSAPLRFNAPNERYGDYPVCHGNQPAMQVAYLFNYARAPWLSQKWARAIQDRYYGFGTGDAYLGDEDQGQMSAWFVMSAIGLFQTDGGARVDPIYEIGSPRFEEVSLKLHPDYYPGGRFTIRTRNNSCRNCYVQSARLNGQPLSRPWLAASQLLKGGELVMEMGPEPNRDWGSRAEDVPPAARLPAARERTRP